MDSLGIVVAFYILSAITIVSALSVFLLRNLVHAIVLLILSFLGMAGLFATLSADFIAIAQILIYAGAISVLLVFAVMLTPLSSRNNANSLYAGPGVLAGAAIAALVVFTAIDTSWVQLTGEALRERSFVDTIETIGDQLLGKHLLAFEVASVLLLFALLGAIVLVTDPRGGDDESGDAGDDAAGEEPA
jgi:NADH:ubiquinone oxidoreductase subunit 6 (subunit J)